MHCALVRSLPKVEHRFGRFRSPDNVASGVLRNPTRRPVSVLSVASAAAGLTLVGTASAWTNEDLPAAYPTSNLHTENLIQVAKDVVTAPGGKLKTTVHANASLVEANEIKRAVQAGQAQVGEVLPINCKNANAIYAIDAHPFWPPATPNRRSSPTRRSPRSTSFRSQAWRSVRS